MLKKLRRIFEDQARARIIAERAISLVLFVVGVCILYWSLNYIVSSDNSRSRVTFHDFYEEEGEDVDNVFVGSSHFVRGINAVRFSEKSGETAFNLSMLSQDIVLGYYLVKEALSAKDIKHIYYEVSLGKLAEDEVDETATYMISDYLKNQINRAELLFDLFDSDGYINFLFRLRRNINPQWPSGFAKMYNTYQKKHKDAYINYKGNSDYKGKGQWNDDNPIGTDTVAINRSSVNLDQGDVSEFEDKQITALLKIMDLCEKEGVELTLVIAPYFEYYLMQFGEYDAVSSFVKDLAGERGVDVIDFNLAKDEYFHLELKDYVDLDHVTMSGSDKITDFLLMYQDDPDGDYFFSTLTEKYPERDGVLWAGYERAYVTDLGEYQKASKAKGKITGISFTVSAISYGGLPVNVKLWTVAHDEKSGEWENLEEVAGEKVDEYSARFEVKDLELTDTYRICLLDPVTDEVLYETISRMDMD